MVFLKIFILFYDKGLFKKDYILMSCYSDKMERAVK